MSSSGMETHSKGINKLITFGFKEAILKNAEYWCCAADDQRIITYPENYDSSIPEDILFPEFILKKTVPWKDKVACVSDMQFKKSSNIT